MWSVMMGFWLPANNLKDYISHNPPGATFFLCVLSLAISFICFGAYSYTHTLPNPDVKDWNHLLLSLAQFQLCVRANTSSSSPVSTVTSPLMEQGKNSETTVNSAENDSSITHWHLMVPLVLSSSSSSGLLTDIGLNMTIRASQLNLEGNEILNFKLDFFSENTTYTCLSVSAPANLLPMSPLPPECPASEKSISFLHVEATNQLPTQSQSCYSLSSRKDPTLTVMLTREERNVAVQHLLEVSLCLLGVCLILGLAACRPHSSSRCHHNNGLDQQNEPLIDS
ncbi:transmembrane protein 248 isoform 1-T3 [Pholidichthys leucotaenia]